MDPLTGDRYGLAGGNPVTFVEVDGHQDRRDRGGHSLSRDSVPEKVGADYYRPPRGLSPDDLLEHNRSWIRSRMDEGCTILDCGPAPGRANYPGVTSEFYQMELDEIFKIDYANYFRVSIDD